MIIAPAILAKDFSTFSSELKRIEEANIFPYLHIDVMDGKFVPSTSFPERKEILALNSKIPFELHLMVENPLEELAGWQQIPNVFRVVFHVESSDNTEQCIHKIQRNNWEVGLALSPETPLLTAEPFFGYSNVLQFMTVKPGAQGGQFVDKVESKIRSFTKLAQRPICSVDGGVNEKTLPKLKNWGVEIAVVGSALMKAEDILAAYIRLQQHLT